MKRFLVQNVKTLEIRITSLSETMKVGQTYREHGARWRVADVARDSVGNKLYPATAPNGKRVMVTVPEDAPRQTRRARDTSPTAAVKLTVDDWDRITEALERQLADVSRVVEEGLPEGQVARSIHAQRDALVALLDKIEGAWRLTNRGRNRRPAVGALRAP
jgi:hypothetical protein